MPVGEKVSRALTMRVTAKRAGLYSGKIVIMTNESNPAQARIEVPYTVSVAFGRIDFVAGMEFGGKAALQSGLYFPSLGASIDVDPSCRMVGGKNDAAESGWGTHCTSDGFRMQSVVVNMTNHFDVCIQASSLELLHHELSLHVAEGFYDSCVEPEESWPPLKIAFKSKRSSLLSKCPCASLPMW